MNNYSRRKTRQDISQAFKDVRDHILDKEFDRLITESIDHFESEIDHLIDWMHLIRIGT